MKKQINSLAIVFFFLSIFSAIDAFAGHRKDIWDYNSTEREELRGLMIDYITTSIVNDHGAVMSAVHGQTNDDIFLTWHRDYIREMEEWLIDEGHSRYVPLPKWDPDTDLPYAFRRSSSYNSITLNTLPQEPFNNAAFPYDFSDFRNESDLCNHSDRFDFSSDLESEHNAVHMAIGGSFSDPMRASGWALFWLWHAWVDDVFWDYNCNCGDDNDYFVNMGTANIDASTVFQAFEGGNVITRVYYPSGDPLIVMAEDDLCSANTMDAGINLEIRAGKTIELKSGFHAQSGVTFKAFIGCGSVDGDPSLKQQNIEIEQLSLQDDQLPGTEMTVEAYPNPAIDEVHLKITGSEKRNMVAVFDLQGKPIVPFFPVESEGIASLVKINLSDYPSGSYIITTYNGQSSRSVTISKVQ